MQNLFISVLVLVNPKFLVQMALLSSHLVVTIMEIIVEFIMACMDYLSVDMNIVVNYIGYLIGTIFKKLFINRNINYNNKMNTSNYLILWICLNIS